MIACTSPGRITRSTPRRISASPARACRFADLEQRVAHQPTAPFEAHAEQLLRLDRELHRQLAEHLLAEAVDDHRDRVLLGEAALPAVEELVLADLRGRRLVLDGARRRSSPRCTGRCARRTCRRSAASRTASSCARPSRLRADPHQAAVGVLAVAGGDALRDDRAARVLADVDHLRAGVGLLAVVGERDRVELADRVVALQDAARVLPGDRRAGLDLRPRDLRALAAAARRAWSRSCRCRPCLPCRPGTSSARSST